MKKSLKILLISIAILLIIGIIFGVIFYRIKNKNNDNTTTEVSYMICIGEDSSSNSYIFIDKDGNMKKISKENYDIDESFINNRTIAKKDSQYCIIDSSENVIVEFGIYSSIDRIDESEYYKVKSKETKKYGVINGNGEIIVPIEYDMKDLVTFSLGVIAQKSGKSDIYTFTKGKIASNVEIDIDSKVRQSVHSVISDETTGILEYTVNEDGDIAYMNLSTGEIIETCKKNETSKSFNIYKGCTLLKNDKNIKICIYDDQLNVVKELEYTDKNISIFDSNFKFIVVNISGNNYYVYNNKGENLYNTNKKLELETLSDDSSTIFIEDSKYVINESFKTIITLSSTKDKVYGYENIYVKNSSTSKYTAYDIDGNTIMENITSIKILTNCDYIEKDNTIYLIYKTNIMKLDEKVLPAKISTLTDHFVIVYFSDSFQIINLSENKVVWKSTDANSSDMKIKYNYDIPVVSIDNKYYTYEGKLLYEKD